MAPWDLRTWWRGIGRFGWLLLLGLLALALVFSGGVAADHAGDDGDDTGPWPAPNATTDPAAYHEYLFIHEEADPGYPNDYLGGQTWKFAIEPTGNPEVDADPTDPSSKGMAVDRAWTTSTGRPDVTVAVLDSGIDWEDGDLRKKVRLNTGELPTPEGSDTYDANGDGVVNVLDYADDSRVSRTDGRDDADDVLDPSDLIVAFEDGEDDDGNGYADDIAGWNFLDDNNRPYDEVEQGHGTGQARGSTGQANNSEAFVGTCPNCQVVPLRVGQSFLAHSSEYARAVRYATDNDVAVIQEALGTVDGTRAASEANRYAWANGVPIMASSADEAAQHHNMPAALRYNIVVNSVRPGSEATAAPRSYTYVNGCTNFGTYVTTSVSSTRCSSEATSRSAGIVGLLQSHARNEVARGNLEAHPEADGWTSSNVLATGEVKALIQHASDDVATGPRPIASIVPTTRYPTTPGWDPYTGNGRLNATTLLDLVSEGRIPPTVRLDTPRRWEPVTPTKDVTVDGEVRAARAPEGASYELQVGCTNDPQTWTTVESGEIPAGGHTVESTLSYERVTEICPDLPGLGADAEHHVGPDENRATVVVRLVATGGDGMDAFDQRAVILHGDGALEAAWPRHAAGSVEATADLADLDGDGTDEVVVPTSTGLVHAYDASGEQLPGFPVATDPLPAAERHGLNDDTEVVDGGGGAGGPPGDVPAGTPGEGTPPIDVPGGPGDGDAEFHTILDSGSHGGTGIADLDGDGDEEIVLTSLQGKVYAWHHDGSRVDGFPVAVEERYSTQEIRDEHNTLIGAIQSAPVLVDMDDDGDREIAAASLDRHLYAWHHDGTPVEGFPVLLADRDNVTVGENDTVTPTADTDAYRGSKALSTPAFCDLDGDGTREFVLGTNEHYEETPRVSSTSVTTTAASQLLGESNGRLFAVKPDGTYLSGWPIAVPNLAPEILPYVGQGIPGSPACGDLDDDGTDEAVIHATAGPVMAYDADGSSHLGSGPQGKPRGYRLDAVGANARASDVPYVAGLGSPTIAAVDDRTAVFAPAAGLGRLLDIALVGRQRNAQDYVAGWDANSGAAVPGAPRPVEDLQFLSTQAVADVDGDGRNDLVAVSAGGSVHAFDPVTGREHARFPKVTGHWMIGTPTVGDVDDDSARELVVTTREGWLWVWETGATDDAPRGWASDHHDAANTGHWNGSAVAPSGELPDDGSTSGAASLLERSDGGSEPVAPALSLG